MILQGRLSNIAGAILETRAALISIGDNDVGSPTGPTISGAKTIIRISESDPNVAVRIVLSEPQTHRVQTSYQTVGGSATADVDYDSRPLTTMTFSPGETSKTRFVNLNQDTVIEGDEVFRLKLSSPEGAELGTSVSTITIENDN